jgi:D-3-phosphoglycerate dehydrogenase
VKYRVALSPSSFAAENRTPLAMLEDAGVEVLPNPYGRRLTEDEAIQHLREVDGLIAGLEPLNRRVLSSASRLRAIARVGIGLDNVDMEAARELGVLVSNTPEGPTQAVAEMTVAAALTLSRDLLGANQALHAGRWEKRVRSGLRDASVLLVGFGRIGRRVAELLMPFGTRTMAVDPYVSEEDFEGTQRMTLAEGLREADIVSLHAAGRETILGPSEFECMRDGVLMLNSARGELVDETAIVKALDSGKVAGAWFDVFRDEPYSGPLAKYPAVLLTPHISTYTRSCRLDMELGAVRNVLRDLGVLETPAASGGGQ